jgi:FkbM family methyltransferase
VSLHRKLNKPYFVFRPGQALRRASLSLRGKRDLSDLAHTVLPWGLPLTYPREEQTGLGIARRGVFDLSVSETLFRLTDPGDLALDIGANIGHMTSLLAARVGPSGRVIAFEPHPDIAEQLRDNVRRWESAPGCGPIDIREVALSASGGVATLLMKQEWEWNQGSASLEREPGYDEELAGRSVPTARLDEVLRGERAIGVAKVDVEGHEHAVLEGAEELLRAQRIRDIVFEDFDDPPTRVARLLEAHGYTVFSLDHRLLGPVLRSGGERAARDSGDDPSYLATIDPARATGRLSRKGWAALGRGGRGH